MFIEILFKMLLFKGGVLIYAEHCIYMYIYNILIWYAQCILFFQHFFIVQDNKKHCRISFMSYKIFFSYDIGLYDEAGADQTNLFHRSEQYHLIFPCASSCICSTRSCSHTDDPLQSHTLWGHMIRKKSLVCMKMKITMFEALYIHKPFKPTNIWATFWRT